MSPAPAVDVDASILHSSYLSVGLSPEVFLQGLRSTGLTVNPSWIIEG